MRFGCVIVPEDSALVAAAGYDYVEISGRTAWGLEPKAFSALRQRLGDDGLPCLGFNAYCPPELRIAGPRFSAAVARDYALRSADRAAALGVKVVGVGSPFSRHLPADFDRATAWTQAAEFFDVTARAFAPVGVAVCVEALGPCYCNFINHLEEARRLVEQVHQPNLKLVVDFYNMEHSGEVDLPLMGYAPYIAHAHVSDDAGDPYQRWFLRAGKDAVHQARLRRLRAAGYDGTVSVEIDLRVDPAEAARTLAVLRAAAM